MKYEGTNTEKKYFVELSNKISYRCNLDAKVLMFNLYIHIHYDLKQLKFKF